MQGIYSIKNIETGTVYIGKTTDIDRRFREHLYNLRNNIHGNDWLQDDFNEYGESSFHFGVVELTKDIDTREVYWIKKYYQNSYNDHHCRPESKADKLPSILKRVRQQGIERAREAE